MWLGHNPGQDPISHLNVLNEEIKITRPIPKESLQGFSEKFE